MNPQPSRAPSSRPRLEAGAALVVVLGAVMLLTVIVLAFFSSVRTNYIATRYYADGSSVRTLADSTVQLVQAQIYSATTNGNGAWASQPGMIRTYDQNGKRAQVFRLYSWDVLQQANGSTDDIARDDFAKLASWNSKPSVYCDLNMPVVGSKGGIAVTNYPIMDPSLADLNQVEGYAVGTSLSTPTNRAPMPVRWLYVLADGSIAVPNDGPGTATFSATNRPTAANPIVGRFAFWTDDETCKLNLNTASEGTPWDSPRSNTRTDRGQLDSSGTRVIGPGYASSMPSPQEFNRTPGHPAMTCLSPVFTNLVPALKIPDPPHGWSTSGDFNTYASFLRTYLDLVPRIDTRDINKGPGGSYGGSRMVDAATVDVNPDSNPLYATVDEFFFATNRNQNLANISPATVSALRFFLTTSSRAPDITPFNTPRISLWPLVDPAADGQRGAKDALIARCGTIGTNHAFYLQRGPAAQSWYQGSPTITPSGRSSSAFLPAKFFDGSTSYGKRNKELLDYLDKMMRRNVPGLGGSFVDKYGIDNTEQLEVSMFDYIRSFVNTRQIDTVKSRSYNYAFESRYGGGTGSFVPIDGANVAGGTAFVAPLKAPSGKRGFGRTQIITEIGLIFFSTATNQMQAMVVMQPTLLSPGERPMSPWITYAFSGLDGLTGLNMPSGTVSLDTGIGSAWTSRDGRFPLSNFYSPFVSYSPGDYGGKTIRTINGAGNLKYTPASTAPVTISGNTFSFQGGSFQLTLYSGADTARSDPLQTYTFNFPPVNNLPVPGVNPLDPIARMVKIGGVDLQKGITVLIDSNDVTRSLIVNPAVASGSPRGDYRLVAAQPNVPASYFTPIQYYQVPFVAQAHSFRSSSVERFYPTDPNRIGAAGYGLRMNTNNTPVQPPRSTIQPDPRISSGRLIYPAGSQGDLPNLYDTFCAPTVPKGLQGARMASTRPGDWDNGYGGIPDGPYLGLPDLFWAEAFHSIGGTSVDNTLNSLYTSAGPGDAYYFPDKNTTESALGTVAARQIPSAVRFGSLPTGAYPAATPAPWQTLLFCPNPPSRTTAPKTSPTGPEPSMTADHPGFGTAASDGSYTKVPDHALLEFFSMPVVEPYPISEPASTAGKINLNSQIAPFTNIVRTTALRGVLKSVRLVAFPNITGLQEPNQSPPDKTYKSFLQLTDFENRFDINRDRTLSGWAVRFAQGDLYRHASEVCSLFLVPLRFPGGVPYGLSPNTANISYGNVLSDFWNLDNNNTRRSLTLTGDNTREAPYGEIYPRLTTRSNTYTVHLWTQSLKQFPGSRRTPADWATWDENTDTIASEYRGSTLMERYVDPNDRRLPDFATAWPEAPDEAKNNINRYYRFRVISQKQFAP